MNPSQRITAFLNEWLELTRLESHAIQVGRLGDLARIQKNKAGLGKALSDAIGQWKAGNPAQAVGYSANSFCQQINLLFDLESQNSDLLAVRKRQVREKLLLLEQALDDFRRLKTGPVPTSAAA